MPAIMLNPGWPGTFHRSVLRPILDKAGKKIGDERIKTLVFTQGEPQILDDAEFAAVKADIGRPLVYADLDSDGVPTGKVAKDQSKPAEPRKAVPVVPVEVEKPPVAKPAEEKAKAKPDIERKAPA